METFYLWANLLIGLLLSETSLRPSHALPPPLNSQHTAQQTPQITESSEHTEQEEQGAPPEEPVLLNTVSVSCYPDFLDVIIKADMFGVGAPVNSNDIRLGVEHHVHCVAAAASGEEYRITVGLLDCGTKHWMTEDSLVYTNLLIYSPEASPDGLIRMEEAVVPIECHYQRKHSLSSASITPTWIPFLSTQAAVETLEFDLKIMTNDWMYERSSNVFYLGDSISIQASVKVGHHMGLRVFVSSCVATLSPDIYSTPRYIFIEDGCLVDSQLPGSKSSFLPRTHDDQLHLIIDAFRFHNEDRGELYITCHMNALPAHDTEATSKACTFVNGRWRSADGNDYLCGHCQNQNEVSAKPSRPGKFGARGFGKPDVSESWRSAVANNIVWEQEAKVGPLVVLPGKPRSGPLPEAELPPVLSKISRPSLYGSQWRSGTSDKTAVKVLDPDLPTDDDYDKEEEDEVVDDGEEGESAAPKDKEDPVPTLKPKAAVENTNSTASPSDISPTEQATTEMTIQANTTVSEPLHKHNPKR
ncbi:zona pellucida sperm-binding protein 3-like isoform X2 [Halichoeres trimaculatus]|uniref:zona pellucida sperm-binding protein 3-like isoform X2 n=1 Tax=Halichoeres trimaculatus TaxID=147232 RepID=UPI003D9EA92C